MGKHIGPYNGFSKKKKLITDTCNNIIEPPKAGCWAKKPGIKECYMIPFIWKFNTRNLVYSGRNYSGC